jgi:nitroreductase
MVLREPETRQALLAAFDEDNPGKKALAQAPVLIVVCADPNESGHEEGKDYYLADAAIAFEHLCLAATALDLGTCWMGLFDERRLKDVLAIPDRFRVVGVTPLGYPDREPSPRPRKNLAEIAFADRWENPLC